MYSRQNTSSSQTLKTRLRRLAIGLGLTACLGLSPLVSPAWAERVNIAGSIYSYTVAKPPRQLTRMFVDTSAYPQKLIGVDSRGTYYHVEGLINSIALTKLPDFEETKSYFPEKLAPGHTVSFGQEDMEIVYFHEPYIPFPSRALGLEQFARTIYGRDRQGRLYSRTLPDKTLFHQAAPVVIDLANDGMEEIIAVTMDVKGTTTAMLALPLDGAFKIVAASEHTRYPKWISPLGAADFDGDGNDEIALIQDPATNGYLELYEMRSGDMVLEQRFYGFTNHITRTPQTNAAAVIDVDENGIPDILLPRNDRKAISVISLKDGYLKRLFQRNLPSNINSNIFVTYATPQAFYEAAFFLQDGQVAILSRLPEGGLIAVP